MKIKELLADPRSWTQGTTHEIVTDRNETVHRYCILGAVGECYPGVVERLRVLDRIHNALDAHYQGCPRVATWNDDIGRTHAEVLAILEEADV